jgi:hypothetical protein
MGSKFAQSGARGPQVICSVNFRVRSDANGSDDAQSALPTECGGTPLASSSSVLAVAGMEGSGAPGVFSTKEGEFSLKRS